MAATFTVMFSSAPSIAAPAAARVRVSPDAIPPRRVGFLADCEARAHRAQCCAQRTRQRRRAAAAGCGRTTRQLLEPPVQRRTLGGGDSCFEDMISPIGK